MTYVRQRSRILTFGGADLGVRIRNEHWRIPPIANAWSPVSLFAAGEGGAWYDPSDLTTLFQDSAGTTPVTADGQPVGKILDKSGRGNHATQSTAASRPLYKTNGTYHWLQFDGVDDSLSTASIPFNTLGITGFCGVARTAAADQVVYETSINYNTNHGVLCYINSGNTFQSGLHTNGSANGVLTGATTVNAPYVHTAKFDVAALTRETETTARLNGASNNASWVGDTTDNTLAFNSQPLYIGRRVGSSLPFAGRIYSLIFRGALSTAQEITDTETWVNQRTGAY